MASAHDDSKDPYGTAGEEASTNEPVAAPDGSDEELDVDTSTSGPARVRRHISAANVNQTIPIEQAQLETDSGAEEGGHDGVESR